LHGSSHGVESGGGGGDDEFKNGGGGPKRQKLNAKTVIAATNSQVASVRNHNRKRVWKKRFRVKGGKASNGFRTVENCGKVQQLRGICFEF